MTKGIFKFLLLLWAVLALSCRSGPVSDPAAAPAASPSGPERPESGVESVAEGDAESLRPVVPPPSAPATVAPAVTLPLPEADRPEAAAVDGFDLPMPDLAPSMPLAELNRIYPDMEPAVAWPPLDAYWRRADAAKRACMLPGGSYNRTVGWRGIAPPGEKDPRRWQRGSNPAPIRGRPSG